MDECFGEAIGVVSDALRSKSMLNKILKIDGGRELIGRLNSCGTTRQERVAKIRAHLLSGCEECVDEYLAYLDRKAGSRVDSARKKGSVSKEFAAGVAAKEGYLGLVEVYDIFGIVPELRRLKQSYKPACQNS